MKYRVVVNNSFRFVDTGFRISRRYSILLWRCLRSALFFSKSDCRCLRLLVVVCVIHLRPFQLQLCTCNCAFVFPIPVSKYFINSMSVRNLFVADNERKSGMCGGMCGVCAEDMCGSMCTQ